MREAALNAPAASIENWKAEILRRLRLLLEGYDDGDKETLIPILSSEKNVPQKTSVKALFGRPDNIVDSLSEMLSRSSSNQNSCAAERMSSRVSMV